MDTSARKLPWAGYSIKDPSVSVAVFADKTQLVRTPGNGFFTIIHSHDPARLVLWVGRDQRLARWRDRLGKRGRVRFEPEHSETVCGATAHRQIAIVAAAPSAVGLVQSGGGTLGHIQQEFPAMVHVALGFSVAGKPVLMSWIIPEKQRTAYAADEAYFFASVGCSPAATPAATPAR